MEDDVVLQFKESDREPMNKAHITFSKAYFEIMVKAGWRIIRQAWKPGIQPKDQWSVQSLGADIRICMEAASNKAWFIVAPPVDGYDEPMHPCFKTGYITSIKQMFDKTRKPRQESDAFRLSSFSEAEKRYPQLVAELANEIAVATNTILDADDNGLNDNTRTVLAYWLFIDLMNNLFDFGDLQLHEFVPGHKAISRDEFYANIVRLSYEEFARQQ